MPGTPVGDYEPKFSPGGILRLDNVTLLELSADPEPLRIVWKDPFTSCDARYWYEPIEDEE